MPNLTQAVTTMELMLAYRRLIREKLDIFQFHGFEPLMTIQITEATTPEMVIEARQAGAVAGKFYPKGMTTNAENGVWNYAATNPALEAMQDTVTFWVGKTSFSWLC